MMRNVLNCIALSLSLALLGTGCTHAPTAAPAPVAMTAKGERAPAATELFWFQHPCGGTKGVPFKKYHSFAYDLETGVLYGRKSEGATPEPLKNKPKGRVAYDGVYDFFADAGILKACQGANADSPADTGNTPEQPASPTPNRPQPPATPPRSFVAPIQTRAELYYAALKRDLQTAANPKQIIQKFLASPHVQHADAEDVVVDACPASLNAGEVCVAQIDHGGKDDAAYSWARKKMMGDLDLRAAAGGGYEIWDHYCQTWRTNKDFLNVTNDQSSLPGPDRIVHVRLMNCEHSWPQSKFVANAKTAEAVRQKTDLHHIFSTDTEANADRANYEFAEVEPSTARVSVCAGYEQDARIDGNGDILRGGMLGTPVPVNGTTAQGNTYFEPPKGFKGRLARALFYFSTRYNAGMSSLQEHSLRRWNSEEPVTPEESERNEKAYRLTGLRNPFIDMPDLADRIKRFCRIKGGPNDGQGKPGLTPEYCED